MAKAELVCVGTELLSGKVNTHAAWLCPRLREAGLTPAREATIGDSLEDLRDAIREASARAQVLIVCGGLGPTFDDLTREAVAAAFGLKIHYSPALFKIICKRFARYKLAVPAANRRQAWVIAGAKVLPNPNGSAPGQLLEAHGTLIALLPGPFREMAPMFTDHVLPILRARHGGGLHREGKTFRFYGISEAAADMKLKPLLAGKEESFTILAGSGQVELRAEASGTRLGVAKELDRISRRVEQLLGSHLYGFDDDTLESVVGDRLRKKGWTLAAAESCTGGLFGARITAISGSSDYFRGGVVAYENSVKRSALGVSEEILKKFGAVSPECARAMAVGARERLGADVGVSITGIAGPGGGSKKKPVGLVHLGFALPGRTFAVEKLFSGERALVRERSVNAVLGELLAVLR